MLTAAVSWRAATNRAPRSTIAFVTMKLPLPRRPKASVTPRSTRAAPTDSATFIGSRLSSAGHGPRQTRHSDGGQGGTLGGEEKGLRFVEMDDVARLAEALAGVRLTAPQGLAEWRYHGRLVARQLDDAHVVIRADFDYRDFILRQFPETFSVPTRWVKHMMVVADLAGGDAGAMEDALEAAWQLQRSAD